MIKTVIFDIDGTMYDYEHGNRLGLEALKNYCADHFETTGPVFHRTLKEANERITARLGSGNAAIHSRLLRFQTMLEMLEQPIFPHARRMYHAYWDTLIDDMKPEPGLIEFMKSLKSQGIRIGVGTNMTAYIQYKKLERLNITAMIDFLVTSEEAGVEKPDLYFYRYCVKKAGCLPEECLFIGDSLKGDVLAPQESGLYALWYRPLGRPGSKQENAPEVHAVSSFFECMEEGFWGG